jgi:hypothetical protein
VSTVAALNPKFAVEMEIGVTESRRGTLRCIRAAPTARAIHSDPSTRWNDPVRSVVTIGPMRAAATLTHRQLVPRGLVKQLFSGNVDDGSASLLRSLSRSHGMVYATRSAPPYRDSVRRYVLSLTGSVPLGTPDHAMALRALSVSPLTLTVTPPSRARAGESRARCTIGNSRALRAVSAGNRRRAMITIHFIARKASRQV